MEDLPATATTAIIANTWSLDSFLIDGSIISSAIEISYPNKKPRL